LSQTDEIPDLRPLFGSQHTITHACTIAPGAMIGYPTDPNSASRKPKPAVFSLPRQELCTITAFGEASSVSSKGAQKNA
jgi:hypothetical protein